MPPLTHLLYGGRRKGLYFHFPENTRTKPLPFTKLRTLLPPYTKSHSMQLEKRFFLDFLLQYPLWANSSLFHSTHLVLLTSPVSAGKTALARSNPSTKRRGTNSRLQLQNSKNSVFPIGSAQCFPSLPVSHGYNFSLNHSSKFSFAVK